MGLGLGLGLGSLSPPYPIAIPSRRDVGRNSPGKYPDFWLNKEAMHHFPHADTVCIFYNIDLILSEIPNQSILQPGCVKWNLESGFSFMVKKASDSVLSPATLIVNNEFSHYLFKAPRSIIRRWRKLCKRGTHLFREIIVERSFPTLYRRPKERRFCPSKKKWPATQESPTSSHLGSVFPGDMQPPKMMKNL